MFRLSPELKRRVQAELKEYPELKRKITLLEYESRNPQRITENEVIGALSLSRPAQEAAKPAGYVSDKTMRIAFQFQEETERLNRDAAFEIAQELFSVRSKVEKLEFYVSQLPPKQAEVIRKHYFEEISWPALQKELHVSSRTLISRRDDGIAALASMYQYMEQVTQNAKRGKAEKEG